MTMASKDYFAEIAPKWDKISAGFFSDAVGEKALELAHLRPRLVAADIGAGTGFLTGRLIQRGLEVFAVDESEEMLREISRKYGDANVRCLVGKDDALPLPDGSVDRAFANMYLHHVESPPTALREIARILRSGGEFVLTDLDSHDFRFLREEHHDRWLGFERKAITEWLNEAGFVDVTVTDLGERCATQSQASYEQASITLFAAHGVRG